MKQEKNNEEKYLFICDECGTGRWVSKKVPNDYPKLCNPCWIKFKQRGDNWKNWISDV